MARIVCQVLQRSRRISFLWSEGAACFEPYHLEGDERSRFLQTAAQIHAQLTEAGGLAQLGHQLYRALFRLDVNDPGAAAIHAWFTNLANDNRIEQLEFLCDEPGSIPWNVLTDDANSDRFFGKRFSLGVGRRVNPIRSFPWLSGTVQATAADHDLVDRLDDAQRARLQACGDVGTLRHSTDLFATDLKNQPADIILILARFANGRLHLGDDSFGVSDLQGWLQAGADANPDPLVILMGCGTDQAGWQALVSQATGAISGLVANEVLLPPGQLFDLGLNLAQQFARGQKSVGDELRSLRSDAAGLAFSAFCPPDWRAAAEGTEPLGAATIKLPMPLEPYHPFAAYEAADRPLFFGREEETIRCASLVDQGGGPGVFLHGSPAVGKTSFLQAGLLPYLEQDSVGYRVLRDRSPLDAPTAETDYPILILRCTDDLAGQFADALLVFCAQPLTYTTPTGTNVTIDLPRLLQESVAGLSLSASGSTAIQPTEAATGFTSTPEDAGDELSVHEVWIALRDKPDLLGRLLDAITRSLPFELVIAVDQGEELITLVHKQHQRDRQQKAIDMLGRLSGASARCKIVYTLRSQNLGQLTSLFADGQAPADWRVFYLPSLSESKIADALLWPTEREEIPYSDETPHEKFGFSFEPGMVQQVVAEAVEYAADEQQSPLPIVHAVGALLYEKKVQEARQNVVTMAGLNELGGVRKALTKYLESSIARLQIHGKSRTALKELIGKMYTPHSDGTLSRDLVRARELKDHWKGSSEPVEQIVNTAAEQEGLFEIQSLVIGGEQDVYVSLPQDSMAQLGKTIETDTLKAKARAGVIDTLWIMIPLACLAAAITYFMTRNYLSDSGSEDIVKAQAKELTKKANEAILEADQRAKLVAWENARRPLYIGLMAEANQALQAGNALRARQLLLSQPAMRSYSDEKNDAKFPLPDLRGFEWRYLWRHLNSERYLFAGHRGVVHCVAISPDSQWAATGSSHDGTARIGAREGPIRIWSLARGEIIAVVGDPMLSAVVHALAFSPDGKTLASAGSDKQVRLWDVSGLKADFTEITKETKSLAGHTDTVHAVAFGKDANTLASAGADKSVIVWDVAKGAKTYTLIEHAAAVHALAFINDGKTLISAGAEPTIYAGEVDKKRTAIKTAYQTIFALATDGKTMATGGVEARLDAELGMIRFWDIAAGKETSTAIQHASGVFALALSQDGKTIASGGKDNLVRLFDTSTAKEQRNWIGHLGWVRGLALAKDGQTLVSGSYDSTVKAWNPAVSPGTQVIAAHDDWVQALALHHKDTLLASGSRDGSVKLWDAVTGKMLLNLPALKGAVTSLAFASHPDKIHLAAGTRDDKNEGMIKVWLIENDPKQGWQAKERHTLKDHRKGITSLAFAPVSAGPELLVSGCADSTVILWDIETGKAKETYRGHKDEVRCVAFSSAGKSFLSGGRDQQVCVYEVGSKDHLTLKELHLNSIESVAAIRIPDDAEQLPRQRLITAGADQSMRIWTFTKNEAGKLENKNEARTFHSHNQTVSCVLYQERTGLIVSGSWDGSIKLYDFGYERFTLLGHSGAVRAIAMAADQSFLASAGNDGTIRLWRGSAERAVAGERIKK